ncbi:DUF3618 domain-containing protein [Streptomyces sp. QH1-20]|uniref:DUF3618 domain-containing protein n=1 Tax=Streptomyces sp. QH1-20 TaxID=3240934 RepID=UPI0035139049
MTINPQDNEPTPTPEELRARVEGTREELGRTVEALAAEADVKSRRAQQKAAKVKGQVQDKAAQALHAAQEKTPEAVRAKAAHTMGQLSGTAHTLGERIQDGMPEPVREKAYLAAEASRGKRGLLAVAGLGALALTFVAARRRRC